MVDILLKNDTQFINEILINKDLLLDKNVFNHTLNLKSSSIVTLFKKMNEETFVKYMSNKELADTCEVFFRMMFMNISDENKIHLINNNILFKKLLLLKENVNKTLWFDTVSSDIKIKVLEKPTIINGIDQALYIQLIKRISDVELGTMIDRLNSYNIFFNDDSIKHYITGSYKLERQNSTVRKIILNKFLKNRNLCYFLFKIKSFEQLYIFSKYNLNVPIVVDRRNIIFEDNTTMPFNILKELNAKHVNLLIKLQQKDGNNLKPHEVLINAVKLYNLFGYDNAKKILDDKFTYMTESAIYKTSEIFTIDERRQYRIDNQERFFSHKMLNQVYDAISNVDIKYFMNLLELDLKEASFFFNSVVEANEEKIIFLLKKAIVERENKIKKCLIKTKIKEYNKYHEKSREGLTSQEIYKLFQNVKIRQQNIDQSGHVIVDNELQVFLLGNMKVDNDCILRLVLNGAAFGLNDALDVIINNFDQIKEIVETNNQLSLYSVLDIVDIVKVMIFNIPPNERDLTLESITKILNSRTFIDLPKEEVLIKSRELHLERRNKYYSTIPMVEKEIKNDYKYEVMKFDSPDLITIGIDTDSCFKVGGGGEDLLRFCMTNPNGAIVRINYDNKTYMTPVIRNGNTLFFNGIDPMPDTKEESDAVMHILTECSYELVTSSNPVEPIEYTIITNLNQKKFVRSDRYKEVFFDDDIFSEEDIYTDYRNSSKFERFFITKTKNDFDFKKYQPTIKYEQQRNPNYVYCSLQDEDVERINLIINSINYSDIVCQGNDIHYLKEHYQELKAADYKLIMGNKDWFVLVDNDDSIISKCLPFDPRAQKEYDTVLCEIKREFKNIVKTITI